jgi:rfaE bifunctional protein nucleotidyltransferase chain/domain
VGNLREEFDSFVLAAPPQVATLSRPMIVAKLKTSGELAVIRSQMEARGQKLVLTNGCFDLLHAGHVRYLQAARALGEALVVALNGDDSVRVLKGPKRPINEERDRAEVLAALACVDFVTIFQSPRVTDVITRIKPHFYAKGGDYTVDSLDADERKALETAGAQIKILPLVAGKSTSGLLGRIGGEPEEKRKVVEKKGGE